MERLTDKRVAQALMENAEGLRKAGIEPDISALRYIKLAKYEDDEELEIMKINNRKEWQERVERGCGGRNEKQQV